MSEGKLYKNVEKIVADNSYKYPHGFITEKEMAHQILDKAKKEFPKINDFCLSDSDDNWKVLKWFEKWFGEKT